MHTKCGLELLFNKFTQVDASTTRKFGGTGLGLAISKQLVELMGGEIGVNSAWGRGSEFWFSARFDKQKPEQTARRRSPAKLAGARALVVDDNRTNRDVLMAQLAAWNMRPIEAADGPTAVQILYESLEAKDPFQVVLTDMQMPGMDGEALGRIVVCEKRFTRTKLVMMTSLGQRWDADQLLSAGFHAYLLKPVRKSDLFECLHTLLGQDEPPISDKGIVTSHSLRGADRSNVRVLLAEDNITNQQVALGILRRLGLRADAVADGREALESLRSIPYDLVLMDVQMPEMDGLDATRSIRAGSAGAMGRKVPIIAMTAYAMRGDRETCLEAGMDDYIAKPVTPEALSRLLDKWLGGLLQATDTGTAASSDVERVQGADDRQGVEAPVFAERTLVTSLMGDRDLAATIARGFLEDVPRRIEELKGLVEAGDAKGAERQAHSIKGASATVGGEALSNWAAKLEKACEDGDMETVRASLGKLQDQFEWLKKAMEASDLLATAE